MALLRGRMERDRKITKTGFISPWPDDNFHEIFYRTCFHDQRISLGLCKVTPTILVVVTVSFWESSLKPGQKPRVAVKHVVSRRWQHTWPLQSWIGCATHTLEKTFITLMRLPTYKITRKLYFKRKTGPGLGPLSRRDTVSRWDLPG